MKALIITIGIALVVDGIAFNQQWAIALGSILCVAPLLATKL